MSISLYGEQENGNLKLVAEVEGFDNPALAVDALLDDAPRLRDREFVAIDFEAGTLSRVTVDSDEPVNPKRAMTVTGFNGVVTEPVEAPTPKRRRQTRKASSSKRSGAKKSTARKAPAKKAAAKKRSSAKKSTGRKAAAKRPAVRSSAKKGGRKTSPFRTRPDDE